MMSTPEMPAWAWLACYALAIACSVVSLWLTVFPRGGPRGWIWVRIGLALLVVPLVSQADSLAEPWVADDARIWPRLGVFAVGIAAVVALFAHEQWVGEKCWWRKWGRPATFSIVSVVTAAAIAWRFQQVTTMPATSDAVLAKLVQSVKPPLPIEEVFGITDLGRKIPLMRFDAVNSVAEPLESIPDWLRARLIVADSTHSTANCHGWVFTGGEFVVESQYVDVILADNGYRITSHAQAGDLIVYRNNAGEAIHTGIVKAVGDNEFVLVESKWGALDTYFHLPNDQVYSMDFAFYRSSRDGHTLHLITNSPTWRIGRESLSP